MIRNPEFPRPLGYRHSSSFIGDEAVVATIIGLGDEVYESTVFWIVSFVVVDSVYLEIGIKSVFFGPFLKHHELMPCLAHHDTPISVPTGTSRLFITSTHHVVPALVDRSTTHVVSVGLLCSLVHLFARPLALCAAARYHTACLQVVIPLYDYGSARTYTL